MPFGTIPVATLAINNLTDAINSSGSLMLYITAFEVNNNSQTHSDIVYLNILTLLYVRSLAKPYQI